MCLYPYFTSIKFSFCFVEELFLIIAEQLLIYNFCINFITFSSFRFAWLATSSVFISINHALIPFRPMTLSFYWALVISFLMEELLLSGAITITVIVIIAIVKNISPINNKFLILLTKLRRPSYLIDSFLMNCLR